MKHYKRLLELNEASFLSLKVSTPDMFGDP